MLATYGLSWLMRTQRYNIDGPFRQYYVDQLPNDEYCVGERWVPNWWDCRVWQKMSPQHGWRGWYYSVSQT